MGSVPAISQRTTRRSKRNSTPRCQASSRESGEPASAAAYSRRVAGVIEPRRTSRSPSGEVYSVSGALSFSGRRRDFFAMAPHTSPNPAISPFRPTAQIRLWCGAVRKPTRRREVGRGERVLPGVWRLRLPLPWPGVPHCNAWALAAGDGVVLVDTGMHEPGSMAHLERALDQVGLRLELVRRIVCTHAHVDHCGQAPAVRAASGAEVWMHPAHGHLHANDETPEETLARRIEVARQSGVPEAPLRRWAEQRRAVGKGISGELVVDRDLVPGVTVASDLGPWEVIETPGHAPSHVCLHQPERRLLISGDHLLGRVSLYFDEGHTPDPVGEF